MPYITMPKNCAGLRMEDGTLYGCKPGERVYVERPDHLAAIRRSGNAVHIGLTVPYLCVSDLLPDRYCPRCAFNAFPWQRVCPRCGSVLGGDDAADDRAGTVRPLPPET